MFDCKATVLAHWIFCSLLNDLIGLTFFSITQGCNAPKSRTRPILDFLGTDTVTNIWEITLRISVSTDTFYFLYTQNTYKDTFFAAILQMWMKHFWRQNPLQFNNKLHWECNNYKLPQTSLSALLNHIWLHMCWYRYIGWALLQCKNSQTCLQKSSTGFILEALEQFDKTIHFEEQVHWASLPLKFWPETIWTELERMTYDLRFVCFFFYLLFWKETTPRNKIFTA